MEDPLTQKEKVMKKSAILLVLLVTIVSTTDAKTLVKREWVVSHDSQKSEFAMRIGIDGAGNVFVVGGRVIAKTDLDYLTIKYDNAGNLAWERTYNGPGNDYDLANAMAVDRKGNVYVTGESAGAGGSSDIATIKYNRKGVAKWISRYGNPGGFNEDNAYAIAVDASSQVYVAGMATLSQGVGSFSFPAVTIKYNSLGKKQWVGSYQGSGKGPNVADAVAVDDNGNVYAAVWSSGKSTDITTVKYDKAGKQQWAARYEGPSDDIPVAIAVDKSGSVYVLGATTTSSGLDYVTIKYDQGGNKSWAVPYNSPENCDDTPIDMAVDGSGNVYVTGTACSGLNDPRGDYLTVKYNGSGVKQWAARFNGRATDWDRANALALDSNGNVYITGESKGERTGSDYATVKYDTNGKNEWVAYYSSTGKHDDIAKDIALDGAGNIYVTGTTMMNTNGMRVTTIKYSQK